MIVQFSLRSNIMKRSLDAQTDKKILEKILNETSSESRQILNCNTSASNERFFITSTARKSSIDDLNDLRELYAFSLSDIQVAKKQEKKEEEMIFMNSDVILNMKKEIDDASDETRILLNCSIFCLFVLTLRCSLYL